MKLIFWFPLQQKSRKGQSKERCVFLTASKIHVLVSGLLYHVVWWFFFINVSEERTASTIMVETSFHSEDGSSRFLQNIGDSPARIYDIITQNMAIVYQSLYTL